MKWFVSSDIHGFFDEYMNALNNAGFDINNSNHGLIILGDIFDRGSQPLKVYKFLKSIPLDRRILVRGNHEELLLELVERGYPLQHDQINGTYDTLYSILSLDKVKYEIKQFLKRSNEMPKYYTDEYFEWQEKIDLEDKNFKQKLFNNNKLKEIIKWIKSDEWCNYYELDKYIFVHANIPLNKDENGIYSYDPEWRNRPDSDWSDAWWECPWINYLEGYFNEEINKGKTIVCGHWNTSDFWNNLEHTNYDKYTTNPIYYSDNHKGIIGLDTCTVTTLGVNVLVINEDNSLEFFNHNKHLLETDDYFTYEKTTMCNGIKFEIYLDDYSMSYVLAWKDKITGEICKWNCGMCNNYEVDMHDIAERENKKI